MFDYIDGPSHVHANGDPSPCPKCKPRSLAAAGPLPTSPLAVSGEDGARIAEALLEGAAKLCPLHGMNRLTCPACVESLATDARTESSR